MASLRFVIFAFCCFLYQLQQAVAPPPTNIEAYKPSTDFPSNVQESNTGFGDMADLNKMLTKLQHNIDDINVRQKIMEAQMKSPFSFESGRMAAAILDTSQPSATFRDRKILSANGRFLQISPDGTVNGTLDRNPYTDITVESFGFGRTSIKIMIKGTKSNMYLTCSKNGNFNAVSQRSATTLFSLPRPPKPNRDSALQKWNSKRYFNIKSESYNWLLGFRQNGNSKKGKHSKSKHKGSWFVILKKDIADKDKKNDS